MLDFNDPVITEGTKLALANGHNVLNPFHFASTEAEHVDVLLKAMNPPQGALVLDAGCGTGAVAAFMHQRRPDLQFVLLNANAFQLSLCPQGDDFEPALGDFHDMPVKDAAVDVVMFNSAFSHADPVQALKESARVLKDGGRLHISDFRRCDAAAEPYMEALASYAWTVAEMLAMARAAGFVLHGTMSPPSDYSHLYNLGAPKESIDAAFGRLRPQIYEFTRMPRMQAAMDRHQHIGLELSGGKDSLACLFLLRPYWDNMIVYWLNTGSAFPETLETMRQVRALVPYFVEIKSNQPESITLHGIPSDIVPTSATPIGRLAVENPEPLIQDRFSCCYRVLMAPLHKRVTDDGVTLLIRGQKNADSNKGPVRNGQVVEGIEHFYPIQDWTDQQVLDYLATQEITIPRYYEMLKAAPDCLDCSAWWDEGRAAYLKQYHPEAHARYQARLDTINRAVVKHIQFFNIEVAQ